MIYVFRNTVYDCRQATLLSIKKSEGKITPLEVLKLRYHLLFCNPCKRFIAQWEMLEKLPVIDLPPFKLSDEARNRIQKHLIS